MLSEHLLLLEAPGGGGGAGVGRPHCCLAGREVRPADLEVIGLVAQADRQNAGSVLGAFNGDA